MKIKQVYEIVNDATQEVLGAESIVKEDLSDVVSYMDDVDEFIENMDAEKVADIVELMDADDAVDIFC